MARFSRNSSSSPLFGVSCARFVLVTFVVMLFFGVVFNATFLAMNFQTDFQTDLECDKRLSQITSSSLATTQAESSIRTEYERQQAEKDAEIEKRLAEKDAEIARLQQALVEAETNKNDKKATTSSLFPDTTKDFAVGMARTKKQEFMDHMEPIGLGVPIDAPKHETEDVVILYQHPRATPKQPLSSDSSLSLLSMDDAVENCNVLNVVLTDAKQHQQCLAIVSQHASHHIHKWMRSPLDKAGPLNSELPLRHVSRVTTGNGRPAFQVPKQKTVQRNWDILKTYLNAIDDVSKELKPILERIAKNNTVIVMVCNFGQSELLMNFVCAAKSRGLDISTILVFATDEATLELANSLGLTAYYDHRNFEKLPTKEAKTYGDANFIAMMFAKAVSTQIVSSLGYDFLFQDVDIVWYKDPLEYFQTNHLQYDFVFQDDGNRSERYAPYSANSGLYFVRNNDTTRHTLTSLIMSMDVIMAAQSHQAALVAVLAEHESLYGLNIKIMPREGDLFPGGFHYHKKKGEYMRELFAGKRDPYLFHMSWTKSKENKLNFFRQGGEWFVHDQCIQKNVNDITENEAERKDLTTLCCSAEPLFSCHYSDKPSIRPCKDAPSMDRLPSWWP